MHRKRNIFTYGIIIIIIIFFFQAGNLKAGVKQNVGSGQDSGTKVGAYFLMGN